MKVTSFFLLCVFFQINYSFFRIFFLLFHSRANINGVQFSPKKSWETLLSASRKRVAVETHPHHKRQSRFFQRHLKENGVADALCLLTHCCLSNFHFICSGFQTFSSTPYNPDINLKNNSLMAVVML